MTVKLDRKLSKKLAGLSALAAKHKPPVDLTQVPDADITREYMRRFNARRKRAGGRKPILKPCELCGESFGVAELKYHTPRCPGKTAKKQHYVVFERMEDAVKDAGSSRFIVFANSIATGTDMYFVIDSLAQMHTRKFVLMQSPKEGRA
jgi:hypothetical protein